jgi:hypothetical protein
MILIQGEKSSNPNSEVIILIKENKLTWAYNPSEKDAFNAMRKTFTELVPDTADVNQPSPETMLNEIRNFIISDIWNDGFIDVSWYMGSGTSSTGQNLDIDFTIQQLGKAITKKKEYDTYMNSLDTKYDSLKQIWTKLSGEIDSLYKEIEGSPPQANVKNSNFNTGILKQYMDAFGKEVNDLKEQ